MVYYGLATTLWCLFSIFKSICFCTNFQWLIQCFGGLHFQVSGQNDAQLDFNAVQRGDAEMAQKLYRVIRACVEMGENNPIVSIHDQGAGGNCNVVKEIIYPKVRWESVQFGHGSASSICIKY